MNEIERAIALFEGSYNPVEATTEYSKLKQQVFAIAIDALKEKQKREKGCVWCEEDNKIFHDGKHYHFYCSYCGKKRVFDGWNSRM